MTTLALGQNTTVEVISAYAATNQQLAAVAVAPAWEIIGAFWMPREASVSLDIIGSVTLAGVQMKGRLFDVADAVPVSGSDTAIIDGTVDERQFSGAFLLPGGKLYQIQAQVIGSISHFGIVRSSSLF